jgi:hypothetical protein
MHTQRTTETLLEVTRYSYSRNHQRFYAEGTTRYLAGGGRSRTLRRSLVCTCGDWINDREPVWELDAGGYTHERCYTH